MQNGENIQKETLRNEFSPSSSYERIIYGIYRMPTVAEMLRVVSHVIGALAIYAYAWLLLMTLNDKGITELLRIILVTGAPFLVVSVLREWIGAPRPYDIYPFFEKKPKNKKCNYHKVYLLKVKILSIILQQLLQKINCFDMKTLKYFA